MRDQMNTEPEPKTPWTDAQTKSADRYGDRDVVPAVLARRLEAERDQARAELQKWKEQLSLETAGGPTGDLMRTSRSWQSVRSERDQLRSQLAAIERADRLVDHDLLALLQDCQTGNASCQFTKQAIERVMAKHLAARDEALKVAREALKKTVDSTVHAVDGITGETVLNTLECPDPKLFAQDCLTAITRIEELTKEKP